MFKGIFGKFLARVAMVGLVFSFLSAVPTSAVTSISVGNQSLYSWVNLAGAVNVTMNDFNTYTENIPANAVAVRVDYFLDDERVRVSPYGNTSYLFDNTNSGNTFVAYTREASEAATSMIAIKYDEQIAASSSDYTVAIAYAPLAPSITSIVRNVDNATAQMTFTAPAADSSGLPITDYEYNLNDGSGWQSLGTNAAGTVTISIFKTQSVYNVTLRAVNQNVVRARANGELNAGGVVSSVFDTGVTTAQVLGSVGSVPYVGEGNGTAIFDIELLSVNINDSASTVFNLTNQPSGSNASISTTANVGGNGVAASNVVTVTTANNLGGNVFQGESTATVTISNAGGLIAGLYEVTATPSFMMRQQGAKVQRVSFTVTTREDEPKLAAVNAVRAAHFNGSDVNTGTIRDLVVVAAGGRLADYAAGTPSGTIRLRGDLISFPTGGYVNTFAAANNGTTAGGNFISGPTAAAVAGSNMVTLTDDAFDDCQPTVSNDDSAATYTSGTNTISVAAECDNVVARGGSASTNLEATGLGFFSFTPLVAGDYVLRIWQDSDNNGVVNVNEVRVDLTITIATYPAFSTQYSSSVINAVSPNSTTGVAAKASSVAACGGLGAFLCDETILAPRGTVTAATYLPVAQVLVTLKDANDLPLDSRSTFPAITATVKGPGTVAIDDTGAATTPVGRSVSFTPTSLLTNAGGPETIWVTIFNDGTGGESEIEIKVGTTVLATEKLSFYGPVATVTAATSGVRKVLPATSGTYGCTTSVTACDSTTVAKTPAVKLVAKDANGIAVPYRTYSAVSSADTTIAGILATAPVAGSLVDQTSGNSWFTVTVLSGTTVKSGAAATLTYSTNIGTSTAPVLISSAPVPFTLGGPAASATMAITGGSNVGDKSTMVFTVKDAAGNASFDSDHTLALKSNIALTTAIGQLAATANALSVIGGTDDIDFFNPLVSGNVEITGLIDGLLTVSASKAVSNNTVEASTDAALEAIDAANAATDAANLAAEAADAATVAAEEARDAADAATAAVEALASEISTLMASLKAQLTTLGNTINKIGKKVRRR